MWLDLIGAWLNFYALRPINNLSIALHTRFILLNLLQVFTIGSYPQMTNYCVFFNKTNIQIWSQLQVFPSKRSLPTYLNKHINYKGRMTCL
jgi:hypothetical protein